MWPYWAQCISPERTVLVCNCCKYKVLWFVMMCHWRKIKMNNLTEFVLKFVGWGTRLWNSGQKNGSESETSQRNPRGEGTTAAREDETVIIVYIIIQRTRIPDLFYTQNNDSRILYSCNNYWINVLICFEIELRERNI